MEQNNSSSSALRRESNLVNYVRRQLYWQNQIFQLQIKSLGQTAQVIQSET